MMHLLRRPLTYLLGVASPGRLRSADPADLGRLSWHVLEEAALRPGKTAWLVARAITLRGF